MLGINPWNGHSDTISTFGTVTVSSAVATVTLDIATLAEISKQTSGDISDAALTRVQEPPACKRNPRPGREHACGTDAGDVISVNT